MTKKTKEKEEDIIRANACTFKLRHQHSTTKDTFLPCAPNQNR